MKKLSIGLVLAFVLALLAGGPAAAAKPGARGGIKVTVHTHSNDDPDWPGLLFDTDRLSYNFTQGEDFSYSSRVCGGRAPFNDLGLDFRPNYPGVDDDADGTAPVRHNVAGTITEVKGAKGTVQGTVTSVLCVNENGQQVESQHSIVSHFEAKYRRTSANQVDVSGKFQISPTQSTGTFQGMEGGGSLKGVFTCLAHSRNSSQPNCAQRGHFTDFVGARGDLSKGPGEIRPGLMGHYRDPTVQPV
ncbi:MAG: hypothetical protein M3N31_07085 [Actinomycetota bacterium]|nr:hypothetical protein [Actinomycetota bacterium]